VLGLCDDLSYYFFGFSFFTSLVFDKDRLGSNDDVCTDDKGNMPLKNPDQINWDD